MKIEPNIINLKIKLFADGSNFEEMINLNNNSLIKGFTTNPTLMRKAGVENYEIFCKKILKIIDKKPVSFEVFADNPEEMIEQAIEISSWAENVIVKIPITNTKGEMTNRVIEYLSNRKISCNVTAIFTLKQLDSLLNVINNDCYTIASIFAGRISDTGIDPINIMEEAVKISKNYSNLEILWASPRELLNIFQAESVGCHIITIPDGIISKFNLIGKNLENFSLETVKMFYNDAKKAGYDI